MQIEAQPPKTEVRESADAPDQLDAFISYSRRDQAFVGGLREALQTTGRSVWVDEDAIPPGAPWRQELGTAIEACIAFVFVISPDSLDSTECRRELVRAVELARIVQ